jgi:hypothetical protein
VFGGFSAVFSACGLLTQRPQAGGLHRTMMAEIAASVKSPITVVRIIPNMIFIALSFLDCVVPKQ